MDPEDSYYDDFQHPGGTVYFTMPLSSAPMYTTYIMPTQAQLDSRLAQWLLRATESPRSASSGTKFQDQLFDELSATYASRLSDYHRVKYRKLALHHAVACKANVDIIRLIKDLDPAAVAVQDQDAMLPIHVAIDSYVDQPDGLLALIKILICGPCANFDFYDGKRLSPPLTYAIQYGYAEDIFLAILEVFPDSARLKDPDGMLPIHCALQQFASNAVKARLLPQDNMSTTDNACVLDEKAIYVVRNPDSWELGNQDGGPGSIGKIVGEVDSKGLITVEWLKTKERHKYRYGMSDDLVMDVIPIDDKKIIEDFLRGETKEEDSGDVDSTIAVSPSSAGGPTDSIATWACLTCTFENLSSVARCELCETPRPKPTRTPLPKSGNHRRKSEYNFHRTDSVDSREFLSRQSSVESALLSRDERTPLKDFDHESSRLSKDIPCEQVHRQISLESDISDISMKSTRRMESVDSLDFDCGRHESDSVDEANWTCSECTFENIQLNMSCEMCAALRPRKQPSTPSYTPLGFGKKLSSDVVCEDQGSQSTVSFQQPLTGESAGLTYETETETSGSIFMVEQLIERFPEGTKEVDRYGRLPLHYALRLGLPKVIVLRIFSIFPDACKIKDKQLKLPIHYAMMDYIDQEVLKQLIEFYPDSSLVLDIFGRAALDYALGNSLCRQDIIQMICESHPIESMHQLCTHLLKLLPLLSKLFQNEWNSDPLMSLNSLVTPAPDLSCKIALDYGALGVVVNQNTSVVTVNVLNVNKEYELQKSDLVVLPSSSEIIRRLDIACDEILKLVSSNELCITALLSQIVCCGSFEHLCLEIVERFSVIFGDFAFKISEICRLYRENDIFRALQNADWSTVENLAKKNIFANLQKNGMSLLHWAVQNKAPTYIVNIIISSEPEIIHRLDQNSKYPIQYAIEAGLDVTTLDLLIEAMNVETKSKRVYVCTLKTPPVLPINEAELYKDTFGILAKVMIKEVEAGVAIIQQEDRGGWVDSMEACLGKTGIIVESVPKKKIWKVKMDESGQEYLWSEELLEIITGAPQQKVADDVDFDRPVDCDYHPEAYEWHLAKIVSDINDEGLFRVMYDDKDSAMARGLPELVGKERMCFYKRIFIVCPSDKSASTINIRKGPMLSEDDSDIVGQIPRGTPIEIVGDAKRVTFKGIDYLRLQLANGTGWTTLKIFDASGYIGLKFVRYSSLEELPNLVMSAISFASPSVVISRLIKGFPSNLLDLINGKSVVHHAVQNKCSRDLIEELVCGIDQDMYNKKLETDDLGRTPLHLAMIHSSSYDVIVYLLEKFPSSCWKKDSFGRLPIHYAIDVNADIETIKALTNCNSEALSEPDNKIQTPLHIAVAGKVSLKAINLLLQTAPISLQIKDCQQMLVLHHALQNDAIDEDTIVTFLENYPESAKVVDGNGKLPLHYMCMRASATMQLFERLLGMNETAATRKDQNNRLPLHYAICYKLAEPIIQYLLAVRIVKHDRWCIESPHPCSTDQIMKVKLPIATMDESLTTKTYVAFDSCSNPEPGNYVTFFRDESRTSFWGQLRYISKNDLPGIQNNPSIRIPTNEFFVMFGTLKFSPGDVIELCEDYAMYTDATGGLLSPGDHGVVIDVSEIIAVEALTGNNAGDFGGYNPFALKKINPEAPAKALGLMKVRDRGAYLNIRETIDFSGPVVGKLEVGNEVEVNKQWIYCNPVKPGFQDRRVYLADGRGWVTHSSYDDSGGVEIFLEEVISAESSFIPDAILSDSNLVEDMEPKAGFVVNFCDSDNFKTKGQDQKQVVIESPHPYSDNSNVFETVNIIGASSYLIVFSPDSKTENKYDFVTFYKDDSHTECWGNEKYSGSTFPGNGSCPPLRIDASSFVFHFHSDVSGTEWGYKITITPTFNFSGTEIMLMDKFGRTPLHYACMMKVNYPIFRAILDKYPNSSKICDVSGSIPLHYLLQNSSSVEVIVDHVKVKEVSSGSNPENILTEDLITFWESDGSPPHWIDLSIPSIDFMWTKIELYTQNHGNYSPFSIDVKIGSKIISRKTDLITDGSWAVLATRDDWISADSPVGNTIRIEILQNHDRGKNSRVSRIKVSGSNEAASMRVVPWSNVSAVASAQLMLTELFAVDASFGVEHKVTENVTTLKSTRVKNAAGKIPLHYAVTLPLGWEGLVMKLLEFDSECAKIKDSKNRLPIECAVFENETPSLDTICALVKLNPIESFKFMFNELNRSVINRVASRNTDISGFPDTLTVGDIVIRGPHWKWQDQDGIAFSPGVVTKYENADSGKNNVSVRWDYNKQSNVYMYNKALKTFHIQLQHAPATVDNVFVIIQVLEHLLIHCDGDSSTENPFMKETEKNNGTAIIRSLIPVYGDNHKISAILDILIRKFQESDIFLAIEYGTWPLAMALSTTRSAFSISTDRKYPLHCAVEAGAPEELLKILLEINPDAASAVDSTGKVPLQYAIEKSIERPGDVGAITLLLQYSGVTYRYPVHVLHEDKKVGIKIWYRAELVSVEEDNTCVVEYTERDPDRKRVVATFPKRVPKNLIVDKTMIYKVAIELEEGEKREEWLLFSKMAKKLEESDVLGNIPQGSDVEIVGDPQIAEVGSEKMKLFQIVDGLGWIPSRFSSDGRLKDLSFVRSCSHRLKHPLHAAIELNASDDVILAVLRGCVGSATIIENYQLPLHVAIENRCSLEVITQLVLAYPEACNVPNENRDSAFHISVMKNLPAVANVIIENGGSIDSKNKDKNTPFECFGSVEEKTDFFAGGYYFSSEALKAKSFSLWFYIISEKADVKGIDVVIKNYVQKYPDLVYAVDSSGRSAIKFAIPKNQIAMESTFLWFTKYRLLEARPEHISATCYVYKATDGNAEDSPRVALKLMKSGAQFLREHRARMTEFSEDYVVSVVNVYNPYFRDESQIRRYQDDESNFPDVVDFEKWGQSGKQLSKEQAEKCYCLVMPLANRNMFVSLKQDRFAGEKLDEIRLVLTQLLKAVEHMHSKGFLHADLKPLNLVRTDMSWRLIDLDASCQIGEEATLSKTSTAYIPPEAYYCKKDANICVLRTRENFEKLKNEFPDLNLETFFLQASPSFDVWSLGCIFYQLCSAAVQPLFQADRDDNISENVDDDDSKWSLAEWKDEDKEQKLKKIAVNEARNLVSQMLSKDPKHRPTIARVLQHPFLTKLKVARLQGQEAEHDIFLSYRVASDAKYTDRLYHDLKACGFKVWMDVYSLVGGEPWKEGFCKAIVNCKVVVCILSREAINSAENPACNYENLESTSKCDNVLLEQTLACELHGLGIVEKIYPIFVGDLNGSVFSDFFQSKCLPQAPDVRVISVEKDVQYVMQQQALGCPLENRSVKKVLDSILSFHGCKLVGEMEEAFARAVDAIKLSFHSSSNTKVNVLDRSPETETISALQQQLEQMRLENKKLSEELAKYDHTYVSNTDK